MATESNKTNAEDWYVQESFEDANVLIREYGMRTVTKFSCFSSDKSFGNIEMLQNSISNVSKLKSLFLLLQRYSTNLSGTKQLSVVVTSLRIDRILATGLGIGRRKIEYSLLSGLVKLNGKTVTKKSIEVKESDVIDRISLEKSTESTYTLGRVNLVEVGETTKKGNFKVVLDRTKLLEITKTEYVKSWEN